MIPALLSLLAASSDVLLESAQGSLPPVENELRNALDARRSSKLEFFGWVSVVSTGVSWLGLQKRTRHLHGAITALGGLLAGMSFGWLVGLAWSAWVFRLDGPVAWLAFPIGVVGAGFGALLGLGVSVYTLMEGSSESRVGVVPWGLLVLVVGVYDVWTWNSLSW